MFIFTWMFDKLGYMPKIDMQVGKVNFELKTPDLEEPAVKKPAVKKPAAKTTTRTKKVK
jgi:hypothetical protein